MARVILKEKDGDKYWLTADQDWLDQVPMLPNEDLHLPTRVFDVGTTIEIRGALTKDTLNEKNT